LSLDGRIKIADGSIFTYKNTIGLHTGLLDEREDGAAEWRRRRRRLPLPNRRSILCYDKMVLIDVMQNLLRVIDPTHNSRKMEFFTLKISISTSTNILTSDFILFGERFLFYFCLKSSNS